MAKYINHFQGSFQRFLDHLHREITSGSVSASYEDGNDIQVGQTNVAVRVYERYSMMGGNRVSMNVTLVGDGENLHLTAITAGGSQAVFFKVNTFGEQAFIRLCSNAVESFQAKYGHSSGI